MSKLQVYTGDDKKCTGVVAGQATLRSPDGAGKLRLVTAICVAVMKEIVRIG